MLAPLKLLPWRLQATLLHTPWPESTTAPPGAALVEARTSSGAHAADAGHLGPDSSRSEAALVMSAQCWALPACEQHCRPKLQWRASSKHPTPALLWCSWENVRSDKDREYYLGHSVHALTGRWVLGGSAALAGRAVLGRLGRPLS